MKTFVFDLKAKKKFFFMTVSTQQKKKKKKKSLFTNTDVSELGRKLFEKQKRKEMQRK